MSRLPLRLRLTLSFAGAMVLVLFALGVVFHFVFEADLTSGIDLQLRSRAQVVIAAIARHDASVVQASGSALIDPDEAFAQVLSPDGRIVETSAAVASSPMLGRARLATAADGPHALTTRVAGVDDPVRLLVVPARSASRSPFYVVVGSTLGDRDEALARLTRLLIAFGGAALVILCAGGWLLAGAALQPVERMRVEADAISASELDRRLPLPRADDELSRLGTTLNALLARLEEAFRREKRFLDQASHELRTPLTVLKLDLDLALANPSDPTALREAVRGASIEADRLVRLAEDLLVLARVQGGRLPVRRVPIDVGDLVRSTCAAYEASAAQAGSGLRCSAETGVAAVDPSRVRQAVEDLLDNALRHGAGRPVEVTASRAGSSILIEVRDHGRGFPPAMLGAAIGPFAAGGQEASLGSGLGLAIVSAVAEAHGGSVTLGNHPAGGAVVRVEFAVPVTEADQAFGANAYSEPSREPTYTTPPTTAGDDVEPRPIVP